MALFNAQRWLVAELSASTALTSQFVDGANAVLMGNEEVPSKPGVYVSANSAARNGSRFSTVVATITVVALDEPTCFAASDAVHRAIQVEGGRPHAFAVSPASKNLKLRYCRRTAEKAPEKVGPNDPVVSMTLAYELVVATDDEPT